MVARVDANQFPQPPAHEKALFQIAMVVGAVAIIALCAGLSYYYIPNQIVSGLILSSATVKTIGLYCLYSSAGLASIAALAAAAWAICATQRMRLNEARG